MGRKPEDQTNRKAELAAFLVGHAKFSYAEAAEKLGTSVSNLSRLLARAEQSRVYRQTVVREFIKDGVTAERLAELEASTRPNELEAALRRIAPKNGVHVRSLHLLPGNGPERAGQGFDSAYLARFGQMASGRVKDFVDKATIVALTWGKTLGAIVDGLAMSSVSRRGAPPITFIPVCAEAEKNFGTMESSSSLASRLNEIFNQGNGERLALTRIPAFIRLDTLSSPRSKKRRAPANRSRSGLAVQDVREIIMGSSRAYTRIFGSASGEPGTTGGLIDDAEMLLTAVGHADHPAGFFYDELKESGRLKEGELKELTVGDIGGILIHRDEASKRHVAALNRLWTGLQYERLERLAVQASKTQRGSSFRPGVVVVNCGRNRAEILEAVIRRGLVNELILDEDSALALTHRLV